MEINAYNLRVVILVHVGLHVPDNLMRKELRKFCGFYDVSFHIAEHVVAKRLDNLRHVEESHIHGVTFERPHCILYDERVVAIRWQEICHGCDRIHRGPVE